MQSMVHGVDTHYELFQAENSSDQLMVLLHGWGCSWEIWHQLIPALTQDFDVLIPDLPAFGASADPTEIWSSHEYVLWLSELLTKVATKKKIVLVGHSFGGKIAALYIAQQSTPLISHLILIDASGVVQALSSSQKKWQTLAQLIPSPLKKRVSVSVRQKILHKLGLADDYLLSSEMQRQIFQHIVHEDIAEQLTHVQVPTTLIWGENDQDTPVAHARVFKDKIPQAKLHIISNVGHFPFVEKPEAVMEIIKGLGLRELEKKRSVDFSPL